MSIALWELLDSFNEISDKHLNWLNPKIAESFAESIWLIIETSVVEQLYWKEWLTKIETLEIPWSTIIQDLTLLSINRELEITLSDDNIYSNFTAILKSDQEIEMFDFISDLYDKFWQDWIVDEIEDRNLFNKVKIISPLYDLLKLLLKWNKMTDSLIILLNNKWVDPINNPLIKPPKEIGIFLDDFKNHLLSLVNLWWKSTFFIGNWTWVMN